MPNDKITDAEYSAALKSARKLGETNGKNAAEWQEQYVCGGRVGPGKDLANAKALLKQLENGEIEINPLSGEYSDGHSTTELIAVLSEEFDLEPSSWTPEETDEAAQEYCDGYSESYLSTLEKICSDFIKNSTNN